MMHDDFEICYILIIMALCTSLNAKGGGRKKLFVLYVIIIIVCVIFVVYYSVN